MKTFKEINAASDAIIDAVFTAYADSVNEDGDAVITDSDTLDDVIEILEILARMDSRLMADIKRERENIRNYKASKVSPANWDTVQILTAK